MKTSKLPVVLYGAGARAVAEIDYIKNQGINPVCFCDLDTAKQGTEYLGLPVLTLAQAYDRYGDFDIYVTPMERIEIFNYLLEQGIKKEHIVNYAEKKPLGCRYLESNLLINHINIQFCCQHNYLMNEPPKFFWRDNNYDIESVISESVELRKKILNLVRNGEPSQCSGCCWLVEDWWHDEEKIKTIEVGFNFPCQLACVYCLPNAYSYLSEEEKRFIQEFDWKKFVGVLEEKELIVDTTVFAFAAGELSINSRVDKILDTVGKYPIWVLTNGIVYNDKIAKYTTNPGGGINISVDSGTAQTYKVVKGLDAFDKVWGNIEKYVRHGMKTRLKYIFLPENSNNVDVDGFIQRVLALDAKKYVQIVISTDIFKGKNLPEKQINAMARMYVLAKQNDINTSFETICTSEIIDRVYNAAEKR